MMSGRSFTTLICSPDFRVPAAYALPRIRWMAAITSPCWFAAASPSAEVHSMFFESLSSTLGNCTSACTDGSHGFASAASICASPVRL